MGGVAGDDSLSAEGMVLPLSFPNLILLKNIEEGDLEEMLSLVVVITDCVVAWIRFGTLLSAGALDAKAGGSMSFWPGCVVSCRSEGMLSFRPPGCVMSCRPPGCVVSCRPPGCVVSCRPPGCVVSCRPPGCVVSCRPPGCVMSCRPPGCVVSCRPPGCVMSCRPPGCMVSCRPVGMVSCRTLGVLSIA